jgi:hypothetical protein
LCAAALFGGKPEIFPSNTDWWAWPFAGHKEIAKATKVTKKTFMILICNLSDAED